MHIHFLFFFFPQPIYYWNNESGSFFITKSRATSQFQVKISWNCLYRLFSVCFWWWFFFFHLYTDESVTWGVEIILTSSDTLSQADILWSLTYNQKCFFKKEEQRNVFPAHYVTAKVEHFSSKCEKCEESSYFRICDSPAEECSACTLPHTAVTHMSFSLAQKEKLHTVQL